MSDCYARKVPPPTELRYIQVLSATTNLCIVNLNLHNHIKRYHVYHLAPKKRAQYNDVIREWLKFDSYTSATSNPVADNMFTVNRGTTAEVELLRIGFKTSECLNLNKRFKSPFWDYYKVVKHKTFDPSTYYS